MKILIKLEEVALFLLGIYLFNQLEFSYWWFVGLFLLPDIGMLGYLQSSKLGSWGYNLFHHRGLAIGVYFFGLWMNSEALMLAGVILFSHTALDRVLGYGLKYEKGFKYSHLGVMEN